MSGQYGCSDCNYVANIEDLPIQCPKCGHTSMERLHWTKGGDGSHWEGCADVHWDCRIAQLEAELARRDEELKITDGLLTEATETIGAVIACCTYNSNDDAKIGVYGIDHKSFTRIDQFITHYNDAVSAGKVSIDVKRDLSDAEIEELGARAAESKQFCPNCEADTPCTHEAELFVCDICGEDFAKYIVPRKCNVSDVSMTRDVSTDVKTPPSIENTNPDYYKDELYLDEDFRMLAKTYPADVSAIGVTALIDYVEALEAEIDRRDEIITRLKEDAERLAFWAREFYARHELEDNNTDMEIVADVSSHRALMAEINEPNCTMEDE